jgi:Histidine kinase-like ATPase domain
MTANSGIPDQGESQSRNLLAPSVGKRWRRVFPGEERQLILVRRWLESLLPDCPARDDVLCIATELGANAIRHTASGRGGRFVLEVILQEVAVRVAIEDSGAVGAPQVIDDPEGEQGRGLLVVEGLSARSGVLGDHRGRTVWAEVPWGVADVGTSPTPQVPSDATIRDGLAGLASRFANIPTWFGRSTLEWWGLARGGLVSAPSALELARLLGRLAGSPPRELPAGGTTGRGDRGTARAGRQQRLASLSDRPELLKVAWAVGGRWARCDRPAGARRSYRPHPSLVSGLGYRWMPVF